MSIQGIQSELQEVNTLLEDPSTAAAIKKTLQLIINLEKNGVLDLLLALTDEKVMTKVMEMIINTGSMRLVDNTDYLLEKLGETTVMLRKPVSEPTVAELLKTLFDKETIIGLIRILNVIKVFGRD